MSSPYPAAHDTSSTESVELLPYTHENASSTRQLFPKSCARLPILNHISAAGEEAFPGGYDRHYSASVESHMSGGTSIGPGNPFADLPGSSEPYPAWSADRQIPMSTEEIEDIFLDLSQKFGFQKDSMRNMVCRCLLRPLLWGIMLFHPLLVLEKVTETHHDSLTF